MFDYEINKKINDLMRGIYGNSMFKWNNIMHMDVDIGCNMKLQYDNGWCDDSYMVELQQKICCKVDLRFINFDNFVKKVNDDLYRFEKKTNRPQYLNLVENIIFNKNITNIKLDDYNKIKLHIFEEFKKEWRFVSSRLYDLCYEKKIVKSNSKISELNDNKMSFICYITFGNVDISEK